MLSFLCADGFSDRFQHDTKIFKFSEVFDYYNIKNVLHPEIMYDNLQLDCISWIIINGARYEINNIICTNIYERSFGKIRYIILNQKKEIFFLCAKLSILSFNRHKNAYKVLENDQSRYTRRFLTQVLSERGEARGESWCGDSDVTRGEGGIAMRRE